ncbi:MAG: fused MFS/spermidine synthase [Candidatus Eisenbacteria bacterium]|nr:fused MFS/spermidine synthase [Candidatus Eisenbacteria bacterium]
MRGSTRFWPLAACFVVSGATSLMLEVVWSKQLSYLLGNSLHGVSTVVAAFMGGLALGSALAGRLEGRVQSPIRVYGLLQIAVGLYALLSLPLLRFLDPALRGLFESVGGLPVFGVGVRFAVVFLLIGSPVLLMGMTLPLLTKAASGEARLERVTGLLYGLNTVGACVGTLLAGYLLVPSLGLLRTALLAGAIDLATGGVALALARQVQARGEEERAARPAGAAGTDSLAAMRGLTLLLGAAGATAMIFEVGWFRLLGLTLGPSVYAFSCMLAVYLAGIGLGSAAAARWLSPRTVSGARLFGILALILAALGLLGLFVANRLPEVHLAIQGWTLPRFGTAGFAFGQALTAACLVLLPCLFSGALFPAALRAAREARPDLDPSRTVARLYFGNTLGSILGSLAAGFWLVPGLGVWNSLKLAAVLSAILGLVALLGLRAAAGTQAELRPFSRFWPAAVGAVSITLLVIFAPPWNAARWNQGLYREAVSLEGERARSNPGRLLFAREGKNASVAVFRAIQGATLCVSGKPDASTDRGDTQTQLLLGHLPLFATPQIDRVLVIGYGSGMTVGSVLAHDEVKAVDVAELEPAVIEASPYFESINRSPLADPRCRVALEDGRLFLEQAREPYDVITSEPSNPWMAGVANLFTVEFYRSVRRHLRPGGVFAQWIQNYRISDEAFRTMLASLQAEFSHLIVFQINFGDLMVLGSDQPISAPWDLVLRRFLDPDVRATLGEIGIRDPRELGFFLLMPESAVRGYVGSARRNTDDNVWLEHRMPIEMLRRDLATPGAGQIGTAAAELGARSRIAAYESLWPGWPLESGLEAIVDYPSRVEPLALEGTWLFDPWIELRQIQERGFLTELRARDRQDLAARVEKWSARGASLRAFREEVTTGLVAARQAGMLTPEMFDEVLSQYEVPLALTFGAAFHRGRGDLVRAEQLYRRALGHPESDTWLDANLGLARLLRDRGENAAAYQLARNAAQRFPYYSAPFVLAARLALRLDDPAAARELVQRGLFFNPGDPELIDAAKATP